MVDGERLASLARRAAGMRSGELARAERMVRLSSQATGAFVAAFVRQQTQLIEIAASGSASSLERAFAAQSLLNRMTLHPPPPQAQEETDDYRAAAAAYRDVSDRSLAEIREAAEVRAGRSVSLKELQILQQTPGQLRPGRGSEPLVVPYRTPEASAVASRSPSPSPRT